MKDTKKQYDQISKKPLKEPEITTKMLDFLEKLKDEQIVWIINSCKTCG